MKVRLGDYIQEYSVKNKDDENISVYSVTNTKGFCKDYFGKEVASKDKTTYKIVPYGYFAYNPSRINVGSVDWQRKEKKVIVSPLYNVFSVSPNLERQYLYYYLKSDFVLQRIKAVATGSVRDNLKLSMLYEFPIELPKLENQRKIVKILDKVSDVIEKKEQELEQLETLVKSRFAEMFGNPLNGTAKYPIHQVGEVANSVDPQPSHRTPPVEEDGVPYVSIKDCDYKTGKIDFEGARKVSPKVLEEHLNRYTLHEGDFVIGKIGTIGNPVFIPARDDYTLSANIVLVQPNRELVSPYFLKYSFESDFVERQFAEAKNSTSQAAFGIQKVRTVKVMNPDLDVQNKFENFVQQVDKSKSKIQKSLEETQLLFDSLMQKYFG
jgi:type I restriction enzyme S subunit